MMRVLALVLWIAAATSQGAPPSAPYAVTRTFALGGDGSWDYIVPDPPHHRLFIARQNRVMVVDEESGALLGEVTGIQGAHGTALAGSSGRGFATSGNDRSVVMFDAASYKVLGRIPAAEDADAILYDAPSNRVFTLNGDAHSSTVIDPVAGARVTEIALGGKPEYGVSAGDGKVYANLTELVYGARHRAIAGSPVSRSLRCEEPAGARDHEDLRGLLSAPTATSDFFPFFSTVAS
jgi:hypothetical protein